MKSWQNNAMRDLDYLKLLSKTFPDIPSTCSEIINLKAINDLPKGTEYFFSDVHGEYEAFSYLLRSSSGIISDKIHKLFHNTLSKEEQLNIANLIYYPKEKLAQLKEEGKFAEEDQKNYINWLVEIARLISSKYTRSKVRKKMNRSFAYAMDELLHTIELDLNKNRYHEAIVSAIIQTKESEDFIIALCNLIKSLAIDHLHLVGDIFDRGPRADLILDELMNFSSIDIQWGNHDVSWIGASLGNKLCIATVLHIATMYNSFDVLEDGYGINLRPLSQFASEVYQDDPCLRYQPHLFDINVSDTVSIPLASKMCKAITIILFKLEGQLIKRHKEWHLENRLLLDKIDLKNKTVEINGTPYPLLDDSLPTLLEDHCQLTPREEELMNTLSYSFLHSEKLQKHIRFLFEKGNMYKIYNGNLLYHGCIPMEEDGSFTRVSTPKGVLQGRDLLDYYEEEARRIYREKDVEKRSEEADLFYYLWCGPKSPLFGKDQMTTFERIFVSDKNLYKEFYDPYYKNSKKDYVVKMILSSFSLDPEKGHIINGHVPVLVQKGESPVQANGRLFRIDGGLAKSYQAKTGIAGYTLIFSSHSYSIAQHRQFIKGEENTPDIFVAEELKERILNKNTDIGKNLSKQIQDLNDLLFAYREGILKENSKN